MKDDNDRERDGTLSGDPFADAESVASTVGDSGEEAWEAPIPIGVLPKLPAFPVDVLPDWFRNWVTAAAEALQCPVDLPAMLVLAVLSLVLAKKFLVRVHPDWEEPINLYIVIGLNSGELKTHAFSKAIRPVEQYEALEGKRLQPAIEAAMMHYEIASKRIQTIQTLAARANDAGERARLKKEAEDALKERAALTIPVAPRFFAEDITSERLAELMREQGGRIGVFSDEGTPFELMAGRYSEGVPNFDIFLKGHSGSSSRTDRIGRQAGPVRGPAITMGLAVQPSVITSLGEKKVFRGKGLLARFLYSIPESMVGHRAAAAQPIPEMVRREYEVRIDQLLRIPVEFDDEGEIKSARLDLESAAYEKHVAFKAAIEPALGPAGELEHIVDWGNKLGGEVIRFAGILHLADRAGASPDSLREPIDEGTLLRAIEIARYVIDHALAAFDMMDADPTAAGARHVLKWIVKHGKPSFDRRHAYLGCRPMFKKPEEIDPALELLIESGYIRVRPAPPRSGAGRMPSPVFDVNPAVLARNARNAQNPALRVALLNSEHSERRSERLERKDNGPLPSGNKEPPFTNQEDSLSTSGTDCDFPVGQWHPVTSPSSSDRDGESPEGVSGNA